MKNLLFLFILMPLGGFAQNPADEILRTKHWCFGFDTGLNTVDAPRLEFSQFGPTVHTDAHDLGAEGHSSTSTVQGALLAYGGHGTGAWYDALNDTIAGTVNTVGSPDRIQGALILPVSNGIMDQYYIFRMKSDGPVLEVDLEYDFVEVGQGSAGLFVSQGNSDIQLAGHVTEALCSVHKCDGNGFWMVAHEYESNDFLIYDVDSTGVDLNTTLSFGEVVNQIQCVSKFSNDGTKLAFAAGRITVNGVLTPRLYLFEFDKLNGVTLNSLVIQCPSHVNGMSFSPNNELLYLSTGTGNLVQYELSNWDSLAIDTSLTYIWQNSSAMPFYLQLALDGKIYGAQAGAPQHTHISRIENPNVKGMGCNYVHNAIYLNGSGSGSGLPNLPESYFNTNPTAYPCVPNGINSILTFDVNLFPNPTVNELRIEMRERSFYKIEVINVLGDVVKRGTYRNGTTRTSLYLDSLPVGTYVISIYTDEAIFNSTITKI